MLRAVESCSNGCDKPIPNLKSIQDLDTHRNTPHMKRTATLKLLALAGALTLTPALHAQSWDFTSNAQSWTIHDYAGSGNYVTLNSTYLPTFNSSGGNTVGFISATDQSGGSMFFASPTGLGNYSAFAGGTLNFSLTTNLLPDYADDSVVILRGSSLSLVAPLGAQPGASWTDYSLLLSAGNFRYGNLAGAVVSSADFSLVLSSLDQFLIDAEFHNGIEETSGLDAVAFQRNSNLTPVPEPSTYGAMGAGLLAGLAFWRRRRRQG
jgi:hypothetical protein